MSLTSKMRERGLSAEDEGRNGGAGSEDKCKRSSKLKGSEKGYQSCALHGKLQGKPGERAQGSGRVPKKTLCSKKKGGTCVGVGERVSGLV